MHTPNEVGWLVGYRLVGWLVGYQLAGFMYVSVRWHAHHNHKPKTHPSSPSPHPLHPMKHIMFTVGVPPLTCVLLASHHLAVYLYYCYLYAYNLIYVFIIPVCLFNYVPLLPYQSWPNSLTLILNPTPPPPPDLIACSLPHSPALQAALLQRPVPAVRPADPHPRHCTPGGHTQGHQGRDQAHTAEQAAPQCWWVSACLLSVCFSLCLFACHSACLSACLPACLSGEGMPVAAPNPGLEDLVATEAMLAPPPSPLCPPRPRGPSGHGGHACSHHGPGHQLQRGLCGGVQDLHAGAEGVLQRNRQARGAGGGVQGQGGQMGRKEGGGRGI